MNTPAHIDIFATKGSEYIFVLIFLIALIFFWKFLHRTEEHSQSVKKDPPLE
jgi:hypothetical protein